MAKFVAVFLLALIAISMLQALVVASNGRGGHHNNNKNKYGPGSLKSFQCPSQCSRRCGQDPVPQAMHVLLSEVLREVPLRSPRVLWE
ncbi:hypothetical protein OIU85_007586 [Salix viminalis]|uniref:Uncharacterized protein n=1 Tax=Salix viminalis TaxID=40686 RepID=A0A9Q0P910_SALVM|nr:hypothetical protein OIU85_007586 [Salix viminalis]